MKTASGHITYDKSSWNMPPRFRVGMVIGLWVKIDEHTTERKPFEVTLVNASRVMARPLEKRMVLKPIRTAEGEKEILWNENQGDRQISPGTECPIYALTVEAYQKGRKS